MIWLSVTKHYTWPTCKISPNTWNSASVWSQRHTVIAQEVLPLLKDPARLVTEEAVEILPRSSPRHEHWIITIDLSETDADGLPMPLELRVSVTGMLRRARKPEIPLEQVLTLAVEELQARIASHEAQLRRQSEAEGDLNG